MFCLSLFLTLVGQNFNIVFFRKPEDTSDLTFRCPHCSCKVESYQSLIDHTNPLNNDPFNAECARIYSEKIHSNVTFPYEEDNKKYVNMGYLTKHVVQDHRNVNSEHNDTSPMESDISPKQNDISPKQNDTSPKQNDTSPKQRDTSPKHNDTSPKQSDTSPKHNDTSPKQSDTTPKQNDTSPKQNDVSPKQTTDITNFLCLICEKVFEYEINVRRHIDFVHKGKDKEKIPCPECNKPVCKYNLKKHIDEVHKGLRKIEQCDICGINYKGNVEVHKNVVHLKKFKMFCDRCAKGFFSQKSLTIHMMRVHGEGKEIRFPCTEEGCSKSFKSTSALKYHVDATHIKEKIEIACEQCERTFTHPALYKKHLRGHKNGPVRYPCTICKKIVTSKHSLIDHMRSHTGERPFVCEHCGQGFVAKKYLRGHAVVHTKERPFACKFCDKRYTQRSPLNSHVTLCHPEVKKNVCD